MKVNILFNKAVRILKNEGAKSLFYKAAKKVKNLNKKRYEIWIKQNENFNAEIMKSEIKKLQYKPLISIVMAVFNPKLSELQEAIESVLTQTYSVWELCLVDASTNKEIKTFLEAKAKDDTRIKIKFLKENLLISGNTNQALKMVSGEFVGFLDHDDTLSNFALFEIVKKIGEERKVDLIYSDEDKITINGKRHDPHFKPDWSPDLLNSYNYITHFLVVKATLLKDIGGIRAGFEGAQDYDLVLRLTEKDINIAHIPKILYHWREGLNSTASDISTKSYAIASGKRALEDKLRRLNIKGEIEFTKYPCLYRTRYNIKTNSKISIVIPTKNGVSVLKKCVTSILEKTSYKNYEILIVNNQSSEQLTIDYLKTLERNPIIKVINYDKEFNFSALNNFASKFVSGDYLVFLNNDTEVINRDWLESLLEHAQRPEVGAVGAKLYYQDNTIQHAGVVLGLGDGFAGHAFALLPKESTGYFARLVSTQNFVAVTGACLMMRKKLFDDVGGFDEKLGLAFNDVDLCLKIYKKGYRIIWTPYAELYHYESYSRGYDISKEKKLKFEQESTYCEKKWKYLFKNGDPYFSPNLSLKYTEFVIKDANE